MKKLFAILLCITLLFMFATACSSSDDTKAEQTTQEAASEETALPGSIISVEPTHADVEFAVAPTFDGEKSLKMNIYSPKNASEPSPVLLYVHGGAWMIGDYTLSLSKTGQYENEQLATILALPEKGITVVSTGYRLSTEATFPAQIHDVNGAIRYLKANAETYNIDPDRIVIMGESAGAQLALLSAVSTGVEELEGDIGGNLEYTSGVIGCIDCYGMTDFTTLAADLYDRTDLLTSAEVYALVDAPNSSRSVLFGLTDENGGLGVVLASPGKYADEIALVKLGSPIFHVTSDDPPIFIANGNKDPRVPAAQAQKMFDALTKEGVEAHLFINSEAGHGDLGPMINSAMCEFLYKVFGM